MANPVRPVIQVSDTPEAMAERVAEDFAAHVKETLTRQPKFTVALAGGVTPKLFYSRLAQAPYASTIPWTRLWLYWGDERCVPKEHPDSNYRMANETLLQRVDVRPTQVFRIHGEDAPPQAARDYEQVLREQFGFQAAWPRFDLILLGMGQDGHTASLMAGSPAMMDGDRWVVGNVVRALQTVRITLTFPAINHARQVWFLVTGAKKAEAFKRAQEVADPACPASLVEPVDGELRWYVDRAVIGK